MRFCLEVHTNFSKLFLKGGVEKVVQDRGSKKPLMLLLAPRLIRKHAPFSGKLST